MFSVIIPLYNKQGYIKKAMQSVLNQTFSAFELIVVDNNSTDHGFHLAQEIKDERIRFISETNKGVSFARNKGIQSSKFEYICFLDADDYWHTNHLKQLFDLIQEYPNAGCWADLYEIIESNGNKRSVVISQSKLQSSFILENYFKKIAFGDSPIHINSACVPKKVLTEFNGFHESIHYGEDTLLWSSLFLNYPIVISNHMGSVYQRSADNRSDIPEKLIQELPVIKELEKLLEWKTAAKFQNDIRALIAKQLFLNLISCLKAGRRTEARRFAQDKRLKAFPSLKKLMVLKAMSLFPGLFNRLFFKVLSLLNFIK
ncbi:MAG: glycosyltransferase family 2 protein [Bacteroidia bacterium]